MMRDVPQCYRLKSPSARGLGFAAAAGSMRATSGTDGAIRAL